MTKKRNKKRTLTSGLWLPDLEQSKAAVLDTLECKQKLRVAVNDRIVIEPEDVRLPQCWPKDGTPLRHFRLDDAVDEVNEWR